MITRGTAPAPVSPTHDSAEVTRTSRPRLGRALALGVLASVASVAACDDGKSLPAYKGESRSIERPGDPVPQRGAGFDAAAGTAASATGPAISPAALLERARPLFTPLPAVADNSANPFTDEKVALGRMLYFDTRLSKNQEMSCNTCHDLASFGVDVRELDGGRMRTSQGHAGQFGERNSPTVYNAAFHVAQFWDGRAADVEEQAGKPITNPIEMAMPDEAAVIAVLRSIPGYVELFATAFPGGGEPITYTNMSRAIGAFERKLVTPAPFDKFLAGDVGALDDAELHGLQLFMDVGCTQCHAGATVGGSQFQKLGSVKPWPDLRDEGRAAHTKNQADRFMFKVPSLRNVAKTGPWLHDGSIDSLPTMVEKMAEHQSARGKLTAQETAAIVAFLGSLTGELPKDLIAAPTLPESGPQTPRGEQG